MQPIPQSTEILNALFLLQGIWGLFLIILTWAMRRVLKDIEENTRETTSLRKSVNGIETLLAGNYPTKPELDRLEERLRDAERSITQLQTLMSLRKGERD